MSLPDARATQLDGEIGRAAVATVVVGGLFLATGAAGLRPSLTCPTRAIIGVPCPLCGLSTTARRVLRGDVRGALAADALGLAMLGAVGVTAADHVVRRNRRGLRMPAGRTIGACVLAARWLLLLVGAITIEPRGSRRSPTVGRELG